ncbi:hypothetical protein KM043_017648 [Ampulex compressa]|nr:hypothetical protein KM043_017648 [Ampulex compressa]
MDPHISSPGYAIGVKSLLLELSPSIKCSSVSGNSGDSGLKERRTRESPSASDIFSGQIRIAGDMENLCSSQVMGRIPRDGTGILPMVYVCCTFVNAL